MVVGEGDNHDGTNDNLAVDDDGAFFDGVNTEHSGLGEVDAAKSAILYKGTGSALPGVYIPSATQLQVRPNIERVPKSQPLLHAPEITDM